MFRLPDISGNDSTNLYMKLYQEIKQSIITGELEKNEKLPSKRKLADGLGVSVKTVENAYDQLLLEGFIYSVEKKGYYVSEIENYRTEGKKQLRDYTTKYQETKYAVNLRANRNAMEDFPADTWCRLMRETLSDNFNEIFEPVPFNGVLELRKAIANHLRSFRGMEVSPDQIIISSGTEAMYARLIQAFGRGMRYALPEPSSKRLHELYENNHLSYQVISVNEDPEYEILETTDCQVLHISPAHQYPLGSVLPIKNRIKLLEWVNRKPGRYIVEDDYDSEYVLAGRPVPPLYSIDVNDKVIYMNTFTKSVSPAVRISYMVLPEALMERYLETMSFYSSSVASVEQYTLAKFIEKHHLERYIHRVNRKNVLVKAELLASLESLCQEGLVSGDSECVGTMILLKLHTEQSDGEVKKYLRQKSIITSMLSEYYSEARLQEVYQHVMVVNYSGMSKEQINYLCSVLKNMLINE